MIEPSKQDIDDAMYGLYSLRHMSDILESLKKSATELKRIADRLEQIDFIEIREKNGILD